MPGFNVVIVEGGPAGERAVIQAARAGKRVALVERQHVLGGTRINWGTIPSQTPRESALLAASLTRHKLHGIRCEIADEVTVPELMYRERHVVQRELELANASLARYAVEVFHGHGRFADPHTVAVFGRDGLIRVRLHDVIVIASDTRPHHPADVPFDGARVFDSDTILALPRMPRSMIVLGAGVIGVEYASIFAALGLEVTLVDTRRDLLPYLDREMAALLERELRRAGIIFVHDDHYKAIESSAASPAGVCCITRRGERLEADVLLYCLGRNGNTDDLGLENIGLEPTAHGLQTVNENFQASVPHMYAVGDVIGYPALASTAMEQSRQAIRHAFGIPGPRGRTEELPFAIYAIPEVRYIGQSEDALAAEGGGRVRAIRAEPPRPDHRCRGGQAQTPLLRPPPHPAWRAHRWAQRLRAHSHRPGVFKKPRHRPGDRRDPVQLPDPLGPLPPRRHGGARQRPAWSATGRVKRAAPRSMRRESVARTVQRVREAAGDHHVACLTAERLEQPGLAVGEDASNVRGHQERLGQCAAARPKVHPVNHPRCAAYLLTELFMRPLVVRAGELAIDETRWRFPGGNLGAPGEGHAAQAQAIDDQRSDGHTDGTPDDDLEVQPRRGDLFEVASTAKANTCWRSAAHTTGDVRS